MENNLIKQAGIAGIFILGGVLIWVLGKIGSLNLSLGDITLIIVLVSGGGYIGYCVISYFTGANVSDVSALKELLEKLLSLFDKNGDEQSDSTENTTS